MSKRFIVVEGSGHKCCMDYNVQDTTEPEIVGGEHWEKNGVLQYECLCECYDEETAQMIADALNAKHPT